MLRRLVIPGALAAILVGAAIGAAASYLTSPQPPAAHRPPSTSTTQPPHTGSAAPAPPAATPQTTTPQTTAPVTTSRGATPSAATPTEEADGRLLNDEGYASIRAGEYGAAIAPLRRAVAKLRGTGPADPYEAYANYNLGYALIQVGDCTGAVPPLEVANRLETSPLVDAAIRRAEACAHQGS